jgi:hypothetical protein
MKTPLQHITDSVYRVMCPPLVADVNTKTYFGTWKLKYCYRDMRLAVVQPSRREGQVKNIYFALQ